MSNTDVSINLDEHVELVARVGGDVARGGEQHAANIEVRDGTHLSAVRIYAYGDQDAAYLADTLASLVGQLLATVDRDDVDDDLALNIARNLGAAAEQWARQAGPPSARLGEVADAVAAEDVR